MNKEKIDLIKNQKPIKVWDFAVIGAVVALSFVSLFFLYSQKGSTVQIWVEGVNIQNYDLNQKVEIDLPVALGHIVIVIDGGSVWVHEVDCPDQICKRMGLINVVNQTIVCSPNRVFLRVVGESDFHF